MLNKNWNIKRGDLYLANLNPFLGSEQGGKRPVVVLSNNVGNRFSPTIIVAPLTAQQENAPLPTHIQIHKAVYSETSKTTIMLEQIRVIDRKRISRYLGKLSAEQMQQVDISLLISLGLTGSHVIEERKEAVSILRKSWKENRRQTDKPVSAVVNG